MAKKYTIAIVDDGGHSASHLAAIAAFKYPTNERLYQSTNVNEEIAGLIFQVEARFYFTEAIKTRVTDRRKLNVGLEAAIPQALLGKKIVPHADFHSHPAQKGDQEGFSAEDTFRGDKLLARRYVRTPKGYIRYVDKLLLRGRELKGTNVCPGKIPCLLPHCLEPRGLQCAV